MVKNPYIIIQARMNSERLPGKVMREVGGKPLIGILIERLKKADIPIILATSTNCENDILEEYASELKIECFRGSENNVLDRYYKAATKYNADLIIRLTGDNPLMDGEILKTTLETYIKTNDAFTYISTGLSKTFPLGISAELFSFQLLKRAYEKASTSVEREHVTPFMHQNTPGNIHILPFDGGMKKYYYRLTVDTPEDFQLHTILIEKFNADKLNVSEIISILDDNPELLLINEKVKQKTI